MTTPLDNLSFDAIMPRSYVGTLTSKHTAAYVNIPLAGEGGTSEAVAVPRGVLTISWGFPEARPITIYTKSGGKTKETRDIDGALDRGVVKIPVPDSGTTLLVQTKTASSVGIGKSVWIEMIPIPLGTIT